MNQRDYDVNFEQFKKSMKKNIKTGIFIFVVLIVLMGGGSVFYTVQPDEEAVVIRMGRHLDTTMPGLHFKLPFGIDQVLKVKTKRLLQEEFGFRINSGESRAYGSSYKDESVNIYEKESLMLTGDLNVADVEWVVQYRIINPFNYIFKTRDPIRNIRDVSESMMRRVVGDRSVAEILTTGRAAIASEAKVLMQQVIDKYEIGIILESVKLQDVNPPDSVKASFNEVNAAKQEQEKVINQAEESYNKVIPEARGKAQKEISEAEGYAMALVNRAQGDASKFDSVYTEYIKAPDVTKKRLYLETMEKIFKRFEKVTIVDPKVKGLLPIFQNTKDKE